MGGSDDLGGHYGEPKAIRAWQEPSPGGSWRKADGMGERDPGLNRDRKSEFAIRGLNRARSGV